jgi:hypothetical protein
MATTNQSAVLSKSVMDVPVTLRRALHTLRDRPELFRYVYHSSATGRSVANGRRQQHVWVEKTAITEHRSPSIARFRQHNNKLANSQTSWYTFFDAGLYSLALDVSWAWKLAARVVR